MQGAGSFNRGLPEKIMKILVAFAVESEFAPWRRQARYGWKEGAESFSYHGATGNAEVLVILTGLGGRRAEDLADWAVRYEPRVGIVTGLAGGLECDSRSGDILVAEGATNLSQTESAQSDPALVRLAVECGARSVLRFLTVPRVARTGREKSLLAAAGDAVDMESLVLMPRLSRVGIPVVALRAIADSVGTDLPWDFEAATSPRGEVRTWGLLAQLARRPQSLPGFVRFGMSSWRAARALSDYLERYIDRLADEESFRDARSMVVGCTP
jgi:adenosylhomocysteine nucleosidase